MLKPKPFFIAILLLGTAGGVLRALELRYVYDAASGLAAANHPISLVLVGVTILAVVFALLLAFLNKPDNSTKTPSKATTPIVLACLVLAASSVYDIVEMISGTTTITQFILAGLGLLTALLLILAVTTQTVKLTQGMFTTIAVFWASFWFLLLFAANAGNPVIGQFFYEFMGALFAVLAFYMFAGHHFGLAKPRGMALTLSLGVYFLLLSLLGPVLAWMVFPAGDIFNHVTVSGLLRMLFALVYLLSMPTMIRRVAWLPDEENDEDSGEDDEEEED